MISCEYPPPLPRLSTVARGLTTDDDICLFVLSRSFLHTRNDPSQSSSPKKQLIRKKGRVGQPESNIKCSPLIFPKKTTLLLVNNLPPIKVNNQDQDNQHVPDIKRNMSHIWNPLTFCTAGYWVQYPNRRQIRHQFCEQFRNQIAFSSSNVISPSTSEPKMQNLLNTACDSQQYQDTLPQGSKTSCGRDIWPVYQQWWCITSSNSRESERTPKYLPDNLHHHGPRLQYNPLSISLLKLPYQLETDINPATRDHPRSWRRARKPLYMW